MTSTDSVMSAHLVTISNNERALGILGERFRSKVRDCELEKREKNEWRVKYNAIAHDKDLLEERYDLLMLAKKEIEAKLERLSHGEETKTVAQVKKELDIRY